jgi:hypothetical protein
MWVQESIEEYELFIEVSLSDTVSAQKICGYYQDIENKWLGA